MCGSAIGQQQQEASACGVSHLHSCCQQRIPHERIQHLQKAEVGECCTAAVSRPAACFSPQEQTLSLAGVFLYSVTNVCTRSLTPDMVAVLLAARSSLVAATRLLVGAGGREEAGATQNYQE